VRFAYFYFMSDASQRVRGAASEHTAYWKGLGLPGYLGGPFADRSGGLITFEADSGEEAEELAARDPFRREDLLERYWLKEWQP
jgi:uncharacterized protein YciI